MGHLPYQYPKRKPAETAQLSLLEQIKQLSKEEIRNVWKALDIKLGHNREIPDLTEEQLLDTKTTIESILHLRKLEADLGDPDNII